MPSDMLFFGKLKPNALGTRFSGADDEARTRYLHLGKVALYQMSYIRIYSEQNALYTNIIPVSRGKVKIFQK